MEDEEVRLARLLVGASVLGANGSLEEQVVGQASAAGTWSLLLSALFYSEQTQRLQVNWSNSLLALILIMLTLTTAIGNLFVIVAILIERNLRTIGNYLVLSLAIADLLVACLVMPLAGIYQILERWTLGVLLCDIWTSTDVFCCTASILHLLAIALDRYWAVTRVDYIRCQRNERRILFMIFFVWMAAGVISLAPVLGWKDAQFEWRITNDEECLISQDIGYQIFATCTTFYFPLTLTLVFYWKIYQVARKRIRRKPGNRVKISLQHPSSTSSNSSPSSKRLNQLPLQPHPAAPVPSPAAAAQVHQQQPQIKVDQALNSPTPCQALVEWSAADNRFRCTALKKTASSAELAALTSARDSCRCPCHLQSTGTITWRAPLPANRPPTSQVSGGEPSPPAKASDSNCAFAAVLPAVSLDARQSNGVAPSLSRQPERNLSTDAGPDAAGEPTKALDVEEGGQGSHSNAGSCMCESTGSSCKGCRRRAHQMVRSSNAQVHRHRQRAQQQRQRQHITAASQDTSVSDHFKGSLSSLDDGHSSLVSCSPSQLSLANSVELDDRGQDQRRRAASEGVSPSDSSTRTIQLHVHPANSAHGNQSCAPFDLPDDHCCLCLRCSNRAASAEYQPDSSAAANHCGQQVAVGPAPSTATPALQRVVVISSGPGGATQSKLAATSGLSLADLEPEGSQCELAPGAGPPEAWRAPPGESPRPDARNNSPPGARPQQASANTICDEPAARKTLLSETPIGLYWRQLRTQLFKRRRTSSSSESSRERGRSTLVNPATETCPRCRCQRGPAAAGAPRALKRSSSMSHPAPLIETDSSHSTTTTCAGGLTAERRLMAASTANIMVSTGATAIGQQQQLILATQSSNRIHNSVHQSSNYQLQQQASSAEGLESKRERKAAKTLAIITGVFVMCWLPFFVMAITMPLLNLKPHKYVFALMLWLGYANSMLNPIIYTIFSPDFRKAFKRLLCGLEGHSERRRQQHHHLNSSSQRLGGSYNFNSQHAGFRETGCLPQVFQPPYRLLPYLFRLCSDRLGSASAYSDKMNKLSNENSDRKSRSGCELDDASNTNFNLNSSNLCNQSLMLGFPVKNCSTSELNSVSNGEGSRCFTDTTTASQVKANPSPSRRAFQQHQHGTIILPSRPSSSITNDF